MKKILVVGSLNMDFVLDVPKMPVPGETILGNTFCLVPGGKGANQAYAIGRLGANVSMIGAVGNDPYGEKLKHNLEKVNVDISGIETIDGENTGCAFINVDSKGENSIVVIPGANKMVTSELIDKHINKMDEADIVIMQLEIPIETVTYVAKLAKQRGKIVILDPAPARPLPEELLANVDIIKPNETEVQILTNNSDISNSANQLLDMGISTVIVTLGGEGSMLVTKEGHKKYDAYKVDVVDTTAAGDTFTAGLAKSLLEGKNIDESIFFGHLASAIAVTKKGAQSSIPNMDEINEFILKNN